MILRYNRAAMLRRIIPLLEMVKFQHSLFALPWAFAGAFYAAGGIPRAREIAWILVAMVSARTAAMTFNRIADAKIDAANPRTKDRAIPKGLVSVPLAAGLTVAMVALFAVSAAMLNRLCLALVPVALAIVLGYSYTKRFTSLCHFALGLSLAIAPVGAWLGVRPVFDPLPLLLGAAVLFWIAGADILYSTEDLDFDRAHGIRSVPAALGISRALAVARICHGTTVAALLAAGAAGRLGPVWYAGVGLALLLLAYEHAIVKPDDLRRVNRAFFHVNAVVSAAMFAVCVGDLWQRGRI